MFVYGAIFANIIIIVTYVVEGRNSMAFTHFAEFAFSAVVASLFGKILAEKEGSDDK